MNPYKQEPAREDVPDAVIRDCGGKPIRFGRDYIVPKPLDTRVLLKVVPTVQRTAAQFGGGKRRRPDCHHHVNAFGK